MKKISLLAIAIVMAFLLTGCAQKIVDNSEVALRYEAGRSQGPKFLKCEKPGSSIDTNDILYRFPNNQREWKMQDGARGADEGNVKFTSLDGVPMTAAVRINFRLNTDCTPKTIEGKYYKGGTIQAFHELIAKTRKAYFKDDGTYKTYPKGADMGWSYVLETNIGTAAHQLFRQLGLKYNAQPLWLNQSIASDDGKTKAPADTALQQAVEEQIGGVVDGAMETDETFFKDYSVTVIAVEPDENGSNFKKQYLDRKEAQVAADTAELNKTAKVTAANADAAVRQAEINGYGGFKNWLEFQMVNKGLNPLQPTIAGSTAGGAQ